MVIIAYRVKVADQKIFPDSIAVTELRRTSCRLSVSCRKTLDVGGTACETAIEWSILDVVIAAGREEMNAIKLDVMVRGQPIVRSISFLYCMKK